MANYEPQSLPELDKLFEKLSEGQTPNFLEIMAAISDISKIWSEPEPVCEGVRCPRCQL